jgi:copper(I)-binding protein
MKRTGIAALLLAAAMGTWAQDVAVQGAWVRASVQGQASTGAYMTLTAREPLVLTGASTPMAGIAEVHEMKMEGDVMRMRAVDALPLPPGQPVALKPGSYHIMLMQLKAPLQPQTSVPLTLHVRSASGASGEVRLSVPVTAGPPEGGAASAAR